MTKIAIIYYSSTGHTYQLARAIEEGAVASGADVRVRKVRETASAETIAANSAWKLHLDATRDVQEATLDDLEWADGFMPSSFPSDTPTNSYTLQAAIPMA
jgi:NAD(P)H dehydrogenase (quinone)